MTIQEFEPGFFTSDKNPPNERLSLVDHRLVRPNGEIIYSVPEEERQKLLSSNQIDNRNRPATFNYDEVNNTHEAFMRGVRKVMRRRLHFEAEHGINTPLPADLEDDVAALYGQTGANLEMLQKRWKKDRRARFTTPDHIKRIGNLSETAFLALFTRQMIGEPSDETIVIPSSPVVDQLGYDEQGYNRGYDFRVLKRGGEPIKLQAKTYEQQSGKDKFDSTKESTYSPDILVLPLESVIGGGGPTRVSRLYNAIVRDLNAEATQSETRLIENSTRALFRSINNHIEQS